MSEPIRLNRYLASAGVASRRRCDDLIRSGRVSVNGEPVSELGTRVDPRDEVAVDGDPVRVPEEIWTLAMHKPPEVLVAASDARGRTTVMDLLSNFPGRVFPIGRLDYRSEGLLLFTNDGDLAYRLAHPRFKVEKLYRVEAGGAVSSSSLAALRSGVQLEDGKTQPAVVRILEKGKSSTVLEVTLKEGRKRQIRRMFALFGHEVTRLTRIRFGPLEIGELESGSWRNLDPSEVEALRRAVSLSPSGGGSGS